MSIQDEIHVPRVTQLDSIELDKEVLQVLKAQVENITKFSHGTFVDKLEPEINALLRLIIWKFSVHRAYSTFGQQLLNLKYEGNFTKYKCYACGFFTIVPSYLKDRLSFEKASHRKGPVFNLIHHTILWTCTIVRLAVLSNLLMFLKDGKYPSIIERLLQMRLVSATKQQRSLGYSYMTRELIWHTLIEVLGNMIPLINYYSLQRKIVSVFLKPQRQSFTTKQIVFQYGDKCNICNETPILPHHMGCSHVYCFYCIQGNLLADRNFQCPACGFSTEEPVAIPVPYTKIEKNVL